MSQISATVKAKKTKKEGKLPRGESRKLQAIVASRAATGGVAKSKGTRAIGKGGKSAIVASKQKKAA